MKSQQRLEEERDKIYHELGEVIRHLTIARGVDGSPVGSRIQTQKIKMCAAKLNQLWTKVGIIGLGRYR